MIIGFTSNTGGGPEGLVIREVINHMEDSFGQFLKNVSYGGKITTVIFVPVAVDPDLDFNNNFFVQKMNKIERGKDYYGNWYNSLCFAMGFNPDVVAKMKFNEFRDELCLAMIERLNNPEINIPKIFDYERFKEDILQIIEIYRRAKIV